MSRFFKVVPVVLLAFTLAGCTAGVAPTTSTTATHHSSGVAAVDDGGSDLGRDDLGNGRPLVSNDGLMVRPRVAIAIYPVPGANLVSLRKELDSVAARAHTSLSSIPPGVLDPALLEPDTPAMTLALPPTENLADARTLVDSASSAARASSDVAAYNVDAVLVHDLRFTVSSASPAVLATVIAREGILSDALGSYLTSLGRHQVAFTYTGPLLSDELVESVRAAVARRAHVRPATVTISPRSTTGVGVDMAKEPALVPVFTQESAAHHDHSAAQPAAKASSQSSPSSPWTVAAIALAALLILTLVQLKIRRTKRPHKS